MTSELRDRRIAILAVLSLGALGTAVALLVDFWGAAMWVAASTPLVAFGALWIATAVLLNRAGSTRWMEAFPRRWQASTGALAVIALAGFALPIWSPWLAPLTWVAGGAVVLGVASEDAFITAVAAACGGLLLTMAPPWPELLMEPTWLATDGSLVAAALLAGRSAQLAWGARTASTRPMSG